MKKSVMILLIVLSVSCTVIETELPDLSQKEAIRATLRLKSVDSLFYHTQTGLYISLNSTALSLFMNSAETSATPTHLAVKFFPKNREEQNYSTNLEGISVSYIPFGYDAVITDSFSKSDLSLVPSFTESNPYTVTIPGEGLVDPVDGCPIPSSTRSASTATLNLPIIYAV